MIDQNTKEWIKTLCFVALILGGLFSIIFAFKPQDPPPVVYQHTGVLEGIEYEWGVSGLGSKIVGTRFKFENNTIRVDGHHVVQLGLIYRITYEVDDDKTTLLNIDKVANATDE